jgi:hypothetical protein
MSRETRDVKRPEVPPHMTTTDGISTEEWDRVTDLAFAVRKHLDGTDTERYRRDLFRYLDELEAKYGALPSILATKADFLSSDEPRAKEELLLRAYALAIERRDRRNALAIAHSLADMYLDNLRARAEGVRWLACFAAQLYVDADDQWWSQEYERLKELARALE